MGLLTHCWPNVAAAKRLEPRIRKQLARLLTKEQP